MTVQISQRGKDVARPVTSFLFLRRLQGFKVGADILNEDEMTVVILWWTPRYLTADLSVPKTTSEFIR